MARPTPQPPSVTETSEGAVGRRDLKAPVGAEYSITEAAKFMNVTPAYVRTLIRGKKLETDMRPIAEGAAVFKHIISAEALNEFLSGTPRRSKRDDGRNKFVFYATPQEAKLVDDALRKAGLDVIADMVHTANILKPERSKNG